MVEESESYLDKRWKIERKKALIPVIVMSVSSLGLFFPFVYFVVYYPVKKAYLKIKALLEAENVEELIRNINYPSSVHIPLFSMFALQDLKSLESGKVIFEHLKRISQSHFIGMANPSRLYTDTLSIMASKHGYSYDELIAKFTEEEKPETHFPVPITKVYLIDEPSVKTKCMISGLLINFDTEIIVACPLCGNMAKIFLLSG